MFPFPNTQVDLDAGLAKCVSMALAAYPRLAALSLEVG